jgi:hypothetical protein
VELELEVGGVDDLQERVGGTPLEEEEQPGAPGVPVAGAGVQPLADQLRRHERSAPDHRAGLGPALHVGDQRQAEVDEDAATVFDQQRVLELHVPVDQAGEVRGLEALSDLEPAGPGVDPRGELGERASLEELRDQVLDPLALPVVEEAEDVRMVDPGEGQGLPLEPRPVAVVVARVDQLDGHVPPELRVSSPPDLPHSTGAQALGVGVSLEQEVGEHHPRS